MPAAPETRTAALLDGRYQLGECIGRGGAAQVYRADDILLGRTVAVKVMQADAEALSAPTRVRNEITVLASLTHPALVELYDANVVPGHPCYLVMEYIDGPTLARRLRDGPLTASETTAIARDLASALHAVHAAGVVHRDVKPANVLLAPAILPGADFRAKLADFGVAFLLDTTRVTTPGTIVGTAAYLPPEQIRGEAAAPAGDIYSLGLVLLEALTGQRAFPKATGVGAVMARLFDSPQIPEWLDADWSDLLSRMTAADPALRPTALEVAEATLSLQAPVRPAAAAAPDDSPASPPDDASTTKPLPTYTQTVDAGQATHQDPATVVKILGAAAAALLCVLGAIWTAEAGSGSATIQHRLVGTVIERTIAPAPDPAGGTPLDPVGGVPAPDDDARKEAEKAAQQARKEAEEAQRAEEKEREKMESDSGKGEEKGPGNEGEGG